VLRVANSPFYGLQSRVGSIHDAIVVLGLSAMRSLVLAAAVVTGCPPAAARASARSASGAMCWARPWPPKRWPSPPNALPRCLFLAGLLHDIGRLAMMVSSTPNTSRAVLAPGEPRTAA
jgi:HD-like signal output (HDOD) protein